jgi:hypothetical protein
VDINVVFRRVSAEVSAQASKRDFKQDPVVTSTLKQESVILTDPARVRRQDGDAGGDELAGSEAIHSAPPRERTEVCAPPPGLAGEQQLEVVRTCVRRRLQRIDAMLAQWQTVGSSRLSANAQAYRRSLNGSGMLRERLADMWTVAPVTLALVSLLLALVLCSSEGLTWLHRRDMAAYFARRNGRAIEQLDRSHARAEQLVDRRLATVRPASFRDFERFRTSFDWKGPVVSPPIWAGDAPAPTGDQRAAIEGWIEAMGRRPEGAR